MPMDTALHTVRLYAKHSIVSGDRLHVTATSTPSEQPTDEPVVLKDCLLAHTTTAMSGDDTPRSGQTTLSIAAHIDGQRLQQYIGGRVIVDNGEYMDVSTESGNSKAAYAGAYRITGMKKVPSSPLYWNALITCEAMR